MTLGNVYYEGEKLHEDDIKAEKRPSLNHDWNYELSEWVYTAPQKE